MSFNVRIKVEAHEDTLKAFLWYEQQQQGLGDKFLEALSKRYFDLSLHPNHYGFIDEDPLKILRDVRLEKFPYVIIFEIIDLDVIIYAIHHFSKSPNNKNRKR